MKPKEFVILLKSHDHNSWVAINDGVQPYRFASRNEAETFLHKDLPQFMTITEGDEFAISEVKQTLESKTVSYITVKETS